MPEFRIKWAAAGAIYAGMLYGIIQLVVGAGKLDLPGLMIGAFMGGAIALPLAACHVVAAFAVLLLARRQSFATQFALFTSMSFGAWLLTVHAIDQAFRQAGWSNQSNAGLGWLAFFVAGTGACLICMIAAARTARQS